MRWVSKCIPKQMRLQPLPEIVGTGRRVSKVARQRVPGHQTGDGERPTAKRAATMSWYDEMEVAGRSKSLTTGNIWCGVAAVHEVLALPWRRRWCPHKRWPFQSNNEIWNFMGYYRTIKVISHHISYCIVIARLKRSCNHCLTGISQVIKALSECNDWRHLNAQHQSIKVLTSQYKCSHILA